jgi:hypothetical protein
VSKAYLREEFSMAIAMWRKNETAQIETEGQAFKRGLYAGFKIAVMAFGIWKSGRQIIGAQETPVQEACSDAMAVTEEL